jgi:hypothetical protein
MGGKSKKKRAKGDGTAKGGIDPNALYPACRPCGHPDERATAIMAMGDDGAVVAKQSMEVACSDARASAMTYAEKIEEIRAAQATKVVSPEMHATTERIYEAVAEHLSGVQEPPSGLARSRGKHTGYSQLEEMGLFSDTKGNLQRELRERKLLMLAKDRAKTLSLQDVSEHNIFLSTVREKLNQRKETLTKRARLTTVLLNKTRDSRRAQALHQDMQRIKVAEKNFNEDIAAFNAELMWFHATPSFQKAQAHVAENWVNIGKGDLYVQRQEIEKDEETSFEDMLQQMKLEQAEGRLGGCEG